MNTRGGRPRPDLHSRSHSSGEINVPRISTSTCPIPRFAARAITATLAALCATAHAGEAEYTSGFNGVRVFNVTSDGRPQGAIEVRVLWLPDVIPGTGCRAPFVTRLADDPDGAMLSLLRRSVNLPVSMRVTDDPAHTVIAGQCSLMAVGQPTQR